MWIEVAPGRLWSWWASCHDSGETLGGSGVTFKGGLTDGTQVARTYDGREWVWVSPR
jgi:hypothetical protein